MAVRDPIQWQRELARQLSMAGCRGQAYFCSKSASVQPDLTCKLGRSSVTPSTIYDFRLVSFGSILDLGTARMREMGGDYKSCNCAVSGIAPCSLLCREQGVAICLSKIVSLHRGQHTSEVLPVVYGMGRRNHQQLGLLRLATAHFNCNRIF